VQQVQAARGVSGAGISAIVSEIDGEVESGGPSGKQRAVRKAYELAFECFPSDRKAQIRPDSGRLS
jgi:hypothetical protein